MIAIVVLLVDGLGRKQELNLVQKSHVALHVAVISRGGQVTLEAGADGAGVAEVHRRALPLHGTVLHVHRVAIDVKDSVGATFGGGALVVTGGAVGVDGRARRRGLGETEHGHRAPTEETKESITHGEKV